MPARAPFSILEEEPSTVFLKILGAFTGFLLLHFLLSFFRSTNSPEQGEVEAEVKRGIIDFPGPRRGFPRMNRRAVGGMLCKKVGLEPPCQTTLCEVAGLLRQWRVDAQVLESWGPWRKTTMPKLWKLPLIG